MDITKRKTMLLIAPFMSSVCLVLYILNGTIEQNAKVMVVVFWSAVVTGIYFSLTVMSTWRLKLLAFIFMILMLIVPAESIFIWTIWWLNGFGP
jgi:hypothetical protein